MSKIMQVLILGGPFQQVKLTDVLLTGFLVLLFIAVCIGVVFTKHTGRNLHVTLQNLNTEREKLNNTWSQLTLEKATWMADLRVEQIAHEQLHMVVPNKIEMIKP